nr:hypothetical protein [Pediococcus pentosaceus]
MNNPLVRDYQSFLQNIFDHVNLGELFFSIVLLVVITYMILFAIIRKGYVPESRRHSTLRTFLYCMLISFGFTFPAHLLTILGAVFFFGIIFAMLFGLASSFLGDFFIEGSKWLVGSNGIFRDKKTGELYTKSFWGNWKKL